MLLFEILLVSQLHCADKLFDVAQNVLADACVDRGDVYPTQTLADPILGVRSERVVVQEGDR